jgi:hypothetical protein
MAASLPTLADPATDDVRTPTPAVQGIDTPGVPVTQLIARPGGNPTVTVPLRAAEGPDLESLWRHLAEPAEFFDVSMPAPAGVHAAVTGFLGALTADPPNDVVAADITLLDIDGQTRVVVTGGPVRAVRTEAVRIAGTDAPLPAVRPSDPHWRRMAARTTSKAETDQVQRWLAGQGYADAVLIRSGRREAPFLGALVFDTAGGLRGVDNPEPASILDQMSACGLIEPVDRVDECPADATAVWWISPRFETHPVCSVDGTDYPVDVTVTPPFARLP